jgi:hypothetical protein
MPPRHAYWTILVDEQPTAFRAALVEDLQPTFKRLKEKHPSARVVWFQNGKVWNSRLDAQEAMRARGEMGRRGDVRQGGFRDRPRERRPEQADRRDPSGKLEWKPKGSSPIAPGFSRGKTESRQKPDWKPKGAAAAPREGRPRFQKPEWKPKREGGPPKRPWSPTGPRTAPPRSGEKLEWRPKPKAPDEKKRAWIPKEEYKKSQGSKPRARDKNWRPGGEHVDPRQKYKDAKKAKWTRFKQNVRKRWEAKQPRKKKDNE